MKSFYLQFLIFLGCMLIGSILNIRVYATNEFVSSIINEPTSYPFQIDFIKEEQHNIIDTFDVSEQGDIATCLEDYSINVYNQFGGFKYSIRPNYTHCTATIAWEENILMIYVKLSGIPDSKYYIVEVQDFEKYQVYTIAATDENMKLWNELPFHVKDLYMNGNHYYMSDGSLVYNVDGQEGTFYIADNSFFDPMLLLAPIVIPLCVFCFINRKKFGKLNKNTKEL